MIDIYRAKEDIHGRKLPGFRSLIPTLGRLTHLSVTVPTSSVLLRTHNDLDEPQGMAG